MKPDLGFHLDLALALLGAGQVFNVTFLAGQPALVETTLEGRAVTMPVPKFVSDHSESFSEAERVFANASNPIVSARHIADLAEMVVPSWRRLIGSEPVQGTLKIPGRNPMRCSFFLFSDVGRERTGEGSQVVENTTYESQYSGLLGCAIRILPTEPMSLSQIRLPVKARAAADSGGGLVLISGAPGVGKSTTAAAFVDYANRKRSGTIVTAEAPIEVPIPSQRSIVSQREIGVNVRSVAQAVRDAERNFAHTVLVGEIQTLEEESAAFQAARHGLFVVATGFSSNAVDAVKTMAMNLDRAGMNGADLVASTLLASIYQVRMPSTTAGKWEFAYESLALRDDPEAQSLVRKRDWEGLQAYVDADTSQSLNASIAQLVSGKLVRPDSGVTASYSKPQLMKMIRT